MQTTNYTKKMIMALIVLFFSNLSILAQQKYKLVEIRSFSAIGNSSVYDWKLETDSKTGKGNFTIVDSNLLKINSLKINLTKESISKGYSSVNNVEYQTSETDNFEDQKFVLKSAKKVSEEIWEITGIYSKSGTNQTLKEFVRIKVLKDEILISGHNTTFNKDFDTKSHKTFLESILNSEDLSFKFVLI